MIQFENVVVRYPRASINALDGVTLSAAPGKITALAGPNGSGKSTLVKALVKRVELTEGVIAIDGMNIGDLAPVGIARRAAVLPQREDSAFPLSVREYVTLGRFPHVGLWKARSTADERAVDAAIARAGIESFANRRTDEISGGEWQRARLARALAQEAPALVVDEPTTFLDVAHEMAIFELLASLAAAGLAVLLVSHQLNLVARFADEIVLLDKGRVAGRGAPENVLEPSLLERVFEWPMSVTRDAATGRPSLSPLRRPNPSTTNL